MTIEDHSPPSWPPNPFSPGRSLDVAWIVGRSEQREKLKKAVRDEWPRVVVRGPRGMGKTTLVRTMNLMAGVRTIELDVRDYIDPRDVAQPGAAARSVIGALLSELPVHFDIPAALRSSTPTEQDLFLTLEYLCGGGGPRPVVILDEMDFLDSSAQRAIMRLSAKPYGARGTPLWVFVIGDRWGGVEHLPPTSDHIPEVFVGLFDREDILELLDRFRERGIYEFQEDAAELICSETGGHPLFVSALLDALYDARWAAEDHTRITHEDVRDAVSRLEASPPDRIIHALKQGGPAVHRILRVLADDGREALSGQELRDIFKTEWPEWTDEVEPTLDALQKASLLSKDHGVWSHRIPILRGYVRRIDRDEIAAGEKPPRPDAWVAFREAEALERRNASEAAREKYQLAADLDADFWLARWQLARVLVENASRNHDTPDYDALRQARRHLVDIERQVTAGTTAHRSVVAMLCNVLCRLAAGLPKYDATRRELLAELEAYDDHLETPGAAKLLAETATFAWLQQLTGDARFWPDKTRKALRSHPYVGSDRLWQQMADLVSERLDSRSASSESSAAPLDLVRFVVPILLDERPSDDVAERLAEATRSWLHDNVRLHRNQPLIAWLSASAWDSFLRTPPKEMSSLFLQELVPWLQHDLAWFLVNGAETEIEQTARMILDPLFARTVGEDQADAATRHLWTALEEVVLACDTFDGRARLLEPLGRALIVLRNTRPSSRADVDSLIALYLSLWAPNEEVLASLSAIETWEALLRDTPMSAFLKRLRRQPRTESRGGLDDVEKRQVEEWLGGVYTVSRRLPIFLPGYPAETLSEVLRAYLATSGEGNDLQRVMIRTFQLRSTIGHVAALMRAMWERERRALATLSLAPAGRALLRFRDARWLDSDNVAILVTDWPGTTTLRQILREQRDASIREIKGRAEFWSQFMPILEAIDALHRMGFLHRSIAPEAIYDAGPDGSESDEWQRDPAQIGATLRLCHFEWSVYLRGLGALGPYGGRSLNRYRAPEALRAALGKIDRYSGETFSSDLYSLGLTLFECLLRPLRLDDELEDYKSEASYDDRAQSAHRSWLQGLRLEVRNARKVGKIEPFEEALLLQLLEFDVGQRPPALGPLLKEIRAANLVERKDVRDLLPTFTVIKSQTPDPRNDIQNIAFYLRRWLPDIDLQSQLTSGVLSQLIEQDLRGASVFLNRNSEYPLLLQSRSGTLYRLRHFEWDGVPRPRLAFLEVARQFDGDESAGEPIGVLHAGVQLHDIGMGQRNLAKWVSDFSERGWSDLFEIARTSRPFVDRDTAAQREQAMLVDVLNLSTEVEYALGWKEAPYVRVKDGSTLVRADTGQDNLAVTVSAWLERDLHIEVARHREAAGTGVEIGLSIEALDFEAGVVDLGDGVGADDLPAAGVLRPSGNRGIAALYRRRKDVLQQIRDDSMLLESTASPHRAVTELPRKLVGKLDLVLPRLDSEKRAIVNAYRRVRPLLVVQGPPGTGKTTLATEVILQTLGAIPNARILVTAQGHAPLDNLLLRLLNERERNPQAAKALQWIEIVRLKSGNRADSEYPEKVRAFLPYERADVLFRTLRHESERRLGAMDLERLVAGLILEALRPYSSAPTSLLRRVEEGANLVFVTTSAREIEEAAPASFDLVIIEEAARCVPIELLGVMRLARQWLLIGDHQQLPPFGYELVMEEVRRQLQSLIDDATTRGMFTPQGAADRKRQQRISSEATHLHELWRAAPLYMNLFRYLHTNADVRASATLRTQWRMHPSIGTMVSDVFYDGSAVINPTAEELEALTKRTTHPFREPSYVRNQQIIWIDFDSADRDPACAEKRSAGGQLENEAERRTLVAFLRLLRSGRSTNDIAILTPYRKQVEQLRGLLNEHANWFDAFGAIQDRVFTVDSFQGQQAGTVVLSLVRNNIAVHPQSAVGFLAERQRATVMFSRAERLLVILGSSAHFGRFAETGWVGEIRRRAYPIQWTELLPESERTKLAQRYR